MEGLVKGLFNVALDAANDYFDDGNKKKHRDDGPSPSVDRSTWAEVAAGNHENDDNWGKHPTEANYEGDERPNKVNYDDEPQREKWNHNRRPTQVPVEHKQAYRKNASEQDYSDAAEINTEPTEDELYDYTKACSRLWDLDLNRLTPGQDYEINCGEGKKIYDRNDMAGNSLFQFVNKEVFKRPTYARFYALLDNYHADQGVSENFSQREEQEQVAFIEEISRTAPIQYLRKYLAAKQVLDGKEFKECLNRLWFDLYKRDNTRNSSSAFEHVFVGEVKNGDQDEEVSGLHNWVQFYIEEANGRLDYQGYIFPRRRSSDMPDSQSQLITVQFTWNGARKPESSTFIGVSPEFEFALFTLCFFCGQEDNHLALGPYSVNIKCYGYGRNQIGSVFPIST